MIEKNKMLLSIALESDDIIRLNVVKQEDYFQRPTYREELVLYYVVNVSEYIKDISEFFGICLETQKTKSSIQAAEIILDYTNIIRGNLFSKICEYGDCCERLKQGDISFLFHKQESQEYINEIHLIVKNCNISTFKELQEKCKEISLGMDADSRTSVSYLTERREKYAYLYLLLEGYVRMERGYFRLFKYLKDKNEFCKKTE